MANVVLSREKKSSKLSFFHKKLAKVPLRFPLTHSCFSPSGGAGGDESEEEEGDGTNQHTVHNPGDIDPRLEKLTEIEIF